MAIQPKKKKKTCIWRLAVLVICALYALSAIAAFKYLGQAIYAQSHPGVSVSNKNLRENRKLPFPSLQMCSLPREELVPLKCLIEDHTPPGRTHVGALAPVGTICEFKVDFRSADGKVMCYRIDPHFNASSPSRFSSILISMGIGSKDLTTEAPDKHVDPFKSVDGILLHIFDPHERPPPFAGSVVLPVGVASEIGMTKAVRKFPITDDHPQAHFNPVSTFSLWRGHGKHVLVDKHNGFPLSRASATRFYFNTLTTGVETEVNEYTWANALGDTSGISGFLVGFAFWGGPPAATAIWTGCGGRDITLLDW